MLEEALWEPQKALGKFTGVQGWGAQSGGGRKHLLSTCCVLGGILGASCSSVAGAGGHANAQAVS